MRTIPTILSILLLFIVCLALFVVNIGFGSVHIPFIAVIEILLGGGSEKESWDTIIRVSRAPGALTAMLSGAALAVSGALVQTLFRNPLAGPSVLGISSGASLGVALLILVSGGAVVILHSMVALSAIIGAGAVLFLVLLVARRMQDNITLLIFGLMAGYIISAGVSILEFQSDNASLRAFINWGFGSFSGTTWDQLAVLAPVVLVGMFLSVFTIKALDALLLGEDHARSVGVNVASMRILIIVVVGMLAGAVTAFCGPIAFLGLATPHLARGLWPVTQHRSVIPIVALCGAILALACDLISRSPGSAGVLPLNAITSLVGAPVVIWVILRSRYKTIF